MAKRETSVYKNKAKDKARKNIPTEENDKTITKNVLEEV